MDLASLIWLALLFGWVGALLGGKAERKRHDESHGKFARELIEIAHGLKKTRKMVGDGPRITHEGSWRLGDAGKFLVIIAEADETTPA